MKRYYYFITLLLSITLSCNKTKLLVIPEASIVFIQKEKNISEESLIEYIIKFDKVLILFSDSGCYACELEVKRWIKFLSCNPEIKAILVDNTLYPSVYLKHKVRDTLSIPTVLYKNYDLIIDNDLPTDIKYLIVEKELRILKIGKELNAKEIKEQFS